MDEERNAQISTRNTRAEIMRLDLHIHSEHSSDSLSSPKCIIKVAKRRGLDGIAVTDHGTIKGGVEARKLCGGNDFLVIIGTEIATEKGDVLGLFLEREIQSDISADVIDEIHSQGGIAVLPHPFKGHKLDEDLLSRIDAIEVFNSRARKVENDKALALAEKYAKPKIAGSDAHFWIEIGRACTIVEGTDVKRALLAGASKVEGDQTPKYVEMISQLLKSARTKDYGAMPKMTCSGLRKRMTKS
jgi:hypothetical protein